jgi:hypothetical protein
LRDRKLRQKITVATRKVSGYRMLVEMKKLKGIVRLNSTSEEME